MTDNKDLEQVRNDAGPQTFLLVAKIERLHWLSKKKPNNH